MATPASTSNRQIATLSLRRASPTRTDVTPEVSKIAATMASPPEPCTLPGDTEPELTT
jgi:hypothetical protein